MVQDRLGHGSGHGCKEAKIHDAGYRIKELDSRSVPALNLIQGRE
jgi:hypothetical protein